jgi:hypothetical protein
MLYLVGVAHRAQARKPDLEKTEVQHAFERHLLRIIKEVQPVFIAEEDNEEFLADRGELSIAEEIAGEYGIEHRFCEPNESQRSAIGSKSFLSIALERQRAERLSDAELDLKARAIEIARSFPIRERFWLERLSDCRTIAGVFICGDIHIESFGRLLETERIQYKVVKRGIGVNKNDDPYYRAREYLSQHPELMQE